MNQQNVLPSAFSSGLSVCPALPRNLTQIDKWAPLRQAVCVHAEWEPFKDKLSTKDKKRAGQVWNCRNKRRAPRIRNRPFPPPVMLFSPRCRHEKKPRGGVIGNGDGHKGFGNYFQAHILYIQSTHLRMSSSQRSVGRTWKRNERRGQISMWVCCVCVCYTWLMCRSENNSSA